VKAVMLEHAIQAGRTGNIFTDMAIEAYRALPGLNQSALKNWLEAPAIAKWLETHPRKETDSQALGTATDSLILTPGKFAAKFVRWDGGRRQGGKWESFKEAHAGRTILNESEWDAAHGMRDAVAADPFAPQCFQNGVAQAAMTWTFEEFPLAATKGLSVPCKGMPDYINEELGALVDLKTTRNASPRSFAADAFNFGYHIQAAFYVDGFEAATGRKLRYLIVAVESDAPHIVQTYEVPEHILEIGRHQYRKAIHVYVECHKQNRFPGYSETVLDLGAPDWALKQAEAQD
jgi:hypothetical protein